MEFDAFSSPPALDLSPCSICGRKFNPDALTRHLPICQKSAQKKRKVFDASKMRAEGTEIAAVKTPGKSFQRQQPDKAAKIAAAESKKHNWRQKHEEFVNSIRAARGYKKAVESGGPLPPPPPPTTNPDYVQCEHCGRRFNESAAQRHINFCKEQHSRLPGKKADAVAKAKWDARQKYRVPKPKGRGSASTSAVSSGYGAATMNGSYKSPTSSKSVGSTAAGSRGMNGTTGNNRGYQASNYSEERSPSGRALRTGRTPETYTEARQLSAKQRAQIPGRTGQNQGYGRRLQYSPASDVYSDEGDSKYGGMSDHGQPRPGGYHDSGYSSGDSVGARRMGSAAKFCHHCGTKYPITHAKFCCECGTKRVAVP